METLTLAFNPDGRGRCLYSELIDLPALGQLDCQRATEIEFDAVTQQWAVRRDSDSRPARGAMWERWCSP